MLEGRGSALIRAGLRAALIEVPVASRVSASPRFAMVAGALTKGRHVSF